MDAPTSGTGRQIKYQSYRSGSPDTHNHMKVLIVAYMLLGAYTASFLRDWPRHTGSERLILAGVHLVFFILAAIPIWIQKRKEGALRGDAWVWPALTFGMYVLGLALMWYYSSQPDVVPEK